MIKIIKLNPGSTVTIDQDNNLIVKTKDKFKSENGCEFSPKDGDIVKSRYYIAIYKESCHQTVMETYGALSLEDSVFKYYQRIAPETLRLATDAEKEQLFNVLKGGGKRWDADTRTFKEIETKIIPKDGDICYFNNGACERIVIFYKLNSTSRSAFIYAGCDIEGNLSIGNIVDVCFRRLATEAEQQILFKALAKIERQWNAEKQCLEPLKWKPIMNEIYYYPVIGEKSLTDWHRWKNDEVDNRLLKNNLIFRSREDALKAAEKMLNALK